MSVQVVQEVCYLEEAGSDRDIPPDYQAMDVPSTAKPGRLAGWLGRQPGKKRIVYRPAVHLSLDDLEVVSFVPGGASLGTWCWCDVFLRIEAPLALLGDRGQQQADGRWLVTAELLAAWYRTRLGEALARTGDEFGLTSKGHWPEIQADLVKQLTHDCPEGIVWDLSPPHESPCLLRRVRSYEQYLEEVTLKEEFRRRLEQIQRDGSMIRAAEQGRLDEFLKELGEDRLAGLLTPAERADSPAERITTYQQVLGSASDTKLLPGVVIGNFRLLAQLGQGGQGQVWKAHDAKGDRFVVLKLVPPEVQNAASEMARVKETFARTYDLNHQHICPVYLLDEDPRFGWYLVMKYIDGQSLRTYRATYVARHGSFPLDQVVKILRPVAEALDFAHAHKVIHRDIKPENILVVGEAHEVAVVDFGLAAEIHTSISRVSQVRMDTSGTRPYMAPEQWRSEHQDQATDQYGLAVVAYELLDGQPPFDSPDFDILSDCVQNHVPPAIADQPEAVNRVLVRGLAKKRSERYPNCIAFVEALASCVESIQELQPTKIPGTPEFSTRTQPSNRLVHIVLAIVSLVLLGIALLLFLPDAEWPFLVGRDSPKPPPTVGSPDVPPSSDPTPDIKPPNFDRRADSDLGVEPPLAVAPFDAAEARHHQTAWAEHLNIPVEITNSIDMPMVLIPPGEFLMGSPESEEGRFEIEGPQRRVRITQAYYVGKYPVTVGEFRAFIDATGYDAGEHWKKPGFAQDDRHPVVLISWDDAVAFAKWLSEKEGEEYRLLTEAEWEYSCRAGTTTRYYFGDSADALGDYAWYSGNAGGKTHPVGQKKPNAWGLYDMHGLVWEWCSDWYGRYEGVGVADDPTGPEGGSDRVYRGGSWRRVAGCYRSANRGGIDNPGHRNDSLGFRLARPIRQPSSTVTEPSPKPIPAPDSEPEPAAKFDRGPNLNRDVRPPLAVAPFGVVAAGKHQERWAAFLNSPIEITNSIGIRFRLIPPGEFLMGAPVLEEGQHEFEGPQRLVRITQPFYLGIYQVTQQEYEQITGRNPSRFVGNSQRPVESVEWREAEAFARELSSLPDERSAGRQYRLPTEAEWEYACRSGSTTRFTFGNGNELLSEYAWYFENSDGKTHPVGQKRPNAWGLYDMHGNVWEWCADWYRRYESLSRIDDPLVNEEGYHRVARGGSWWNEAVFLRSAVRGSSLGPLDSIRGFRVAMNFVASTEESWD